MKEREDVMTALRHPPQNGSELIANTRRILSSSSWLSGSAPEELFTSFCSIDSQTDHVFLSNSGEYNRPSPRYGLGTVRSDADLSYFPYKKISAADQEFESEVDDIFNTFKESFNRARLELLNYLEDKLS